MTTPTPATVALAAQARRARETEQIVRTAAVSMPAAATVSTVRDEVRIVVRPASLADWQAWVERCGVRLRDVTLAGSYAVALGWHGDVPVRLVGHGVPALTFRSLRKGTARV